MFSRRAALAILFFASACSRQGAKPETERFAILRFENLGGDASADWMGRAFAEVIGAELAGTRGVSAVQPDALLTGARQLGIVAVSAPGVSAGLEAAIAEGANRIGYGDYIAQGGTVRVRFWLENGQTHRYANVIEVAGPAGDVIGLASRLAKNVAPGAAGHATANEAALRGYCEGLEASNPAEAAEELKSAIAADAKFAPPYRLLADIQARESKDEALATLNTALQRAAMTPGERGRVEGEAAVLRGDAAGQERALAEVAKQDATNPNEWRALAELAMNRRDYGQAAEGFRQVIHLQPADTAAMNELSYAAEYGGDTAGALAALDRYKALQPKDPNALDSRGDVYLLAGRLKEAEASYLQANRMNPAFQGSGDLYKAAMARLMTGDVPGANAIFTRYVAARKKAQDREADFKAAIWIWLTGKQADASKAMAGVAADAAQRKDNAIEAQAEAQLALWNLMHGDRVAAVEMARKAAPSAQGVILEAIVVFLAQPSASAAEWELRAAKSIHSEQPGLTDTILAYALLLDGKAAAAAAPLERARNAAGVSGEEGLPVLLAWSDLEAGKKSDAAELLKRNPVPTLTGPGPFVGLYFPRLFELRARATADSREAQTDREIFAKLTAGS